MNDINNSLHDLKVVLMKTINNPKTSIKNKDLAREALDVILQFNKIHNSLETDKEKNSFAYDVFGSLHITKHTQK